MTFVGAGIVFVILWWVVFFMLLPVGVSSQSESAHVVPGSEPGAPVTHNLLKKALGATAIAALLLGIIFLLIETGLLSLLPQRSP